MRCQPGDLAYIDKAACGGKCFCYFGRPTVVHTYRMCDGRPFWKLDPPWEACEHYINSRITHIQEVADDMLRPIRPDPIVVPAPPQEVSI